MSAVAMFHVTWKLSCIRVIRSHVTSRTCNRTDAPLTRMNFVVNLPGVRSSTIPWLCGQCRHMFRARPHGTGQGPVAQAPHPLPPRPQQNKMEDHLDEAIHVLRSHAVGTAGDVHGLLPGHGTLASGFTGPIMPLGGRHAGLVSAGSGAGRVVGTRTALTSPLPVHRLEAATRKMASQAVAASCTTTWPSLASPLPSPTSLDRPTPTVVSPSVVPGQGGWHLSVTCALLPSVGPSYWVSLPLWKTGMTEGL